MDAVTGMTLSIDGLPGEDAEQLKAWLEPILDAVDADVDHQVNGYCNRKEV